MTAGHWDDRYRTTDLVWTAQPNQFVTSLLEDLPPGVAIDLGAGEGRNAVWLAQQGWQVTAVDFSEVGLTKARDLARHHAVEIGTEVGDALAYEPAAPVDLVVIAYLQVTRAAQAHVLARAAQWLRPGGRLLVVAHDRSNVENGYGGPPDPEVCYDVAEVTAALAGLDIERAEVAVRTVETETGPRDALDTVVLARRRGGAADV